MTASDTLREAGLNVPEAVRVWHVCGRMANDAEDMIDAADTALEALAHGWAECEKERKRWENTARHFCKQYLIFGGWPQDDVDLWIARYNEEASDE